MNNYEKLIEALKSQYGDDSKSVKDPDWNQVTSWTGFVPKEIRKAWKDLPYESQLLIYFTAGQAYRQSH